MNAFAGRHVVVTGGAGALGGAVLDALVAAGAICHAPAFEDHAPASIAGRERVVVTAGVDLSDEAAVTAYFAAVPAPWASIHVAGGFGAAPVERTSLADFEAQWRMNVATCFLSCREAIAAMRRGGGGGGRIVNVAARPAVQPAVGGMAAYVTAKAGVAALTQALAAEVLADGILVNAVLPSTIDTPANRKVMPKADHGAWPSPADIARAIAFLASPANALTHGALVPVYGRA